MGQQQCYHTNLHDRNTSISPRFLCVLIDLVRRYIFDPLSLAAIDGVLVQTIPGHSHPMERTQAPSSAGKSHEGLNINGTEY